MFFVSCSVCDAVGDDFDREDWTADGNNFWFCPLHADQAGKRPRAPEPEVAAAAGPEAAEPEVVGFDRPEDGSEARYHRRRAARPWSAHTFWWVVHNAVAHPLIAVLPRTRFFRFHDWTSRKMHGR